ncbi:MAG: hypothetical protein CUN56_16780, partial [Phototrophicales bacterium]
GATAAANAVFNRYVVGKDGKNTEAAAKAKATATAQSNRKIPYAVINPKGPQAHLLSLKR